MLLISQLFIYPIKSLKGIAISSGLLTDRGLQNDRRWMLIDENNRFLSQREHPQMALIETTIQDDELIVTHIERGSEFRILLQPLPSKVVMVKIWDDLCEALASEPDAGEWFSDTLKIKCRLVYMPSFSRRKIHEETSITNKITSFADDYPILMIGQSSLDDLNSKLNEALPMDRFRPNVVFTGGTPFEEDTMEHFIINSFSFYAAKPCARCVVTTIHQQTGVQGKEPLKTLSTYRKSNNNIYFGQNILYEEEGTINIGDQLTVVKRKPLLSLNDPEAAVTKFISL